MGILFEPIVLIISILALLIVGFFISKEISKGINWAGQQIANISKPITDFGNSIVQGASNFANSVQNTIANSTKTISNTTTNIVKNLTTPLPQNQDFLNTMNNTIVNPISSFINNTIQNASNFVKQISNMLGIKF